MSKHYEYNKNWRYKHPQKRYEGKARYYQKTQNAVNGGNSWTEWENELIISHTIPDSELAQKLGRSVSAIQNQRSRIKQILIED